MRLRDLSLSGVLQTRFDNYEINTLTPSITLNVVSQDNNITSDEDDSGIVLSGTTSMAEEGAAISATWNGVDYATTVANDTWWIQVPSDDVAALPDGNTTVSVTVTTGGGAINAVLNGAQYFSEAIAKKKAYFETEKDIDYIDRIMLKGFTSGLMQKEMMDYLGEKGEFLTLSAIEKRTKRLKLYFNAKTLSEMISIAIRQGFI